LGLRLQSTRRQSKYMESDMAIAQPPSKPNPGSHEWTMEKYLINLAEIMSEEE
jgi:hypothetical protein